MKFEGAPPSNPESPSCGDSGLLLERAVQGDQEALIELLAQLAPAIRRTISISPKWQSVLDADDVLQVTFTEAFLRINQFVGTQTRAMETWLFTIARNNVRAAIRGLQSGKRPHPDQRRRSPDATDGGLDGLIEDLGAATGTPSRICARAEASILIKDALNQLPEDYQAVLRSYYLEGLSSDVIAARMSRSRGAIMMILARARERLAEAMGSPSQFFTDSP